MPISGIALGAGTVGGVFLYSALTNRSVLKVFHSAIIGKSPATAPQNAVLPSVAGDASLSDPGSGAAVGGTAAQNQAIAKMLAAPYGWSSGNEWDSLVKLWNRESGWRNTAKNTSVAGAVWPNQAYGIPQALPATKMPANALPPISSASAQIAWGLAYIHDRYGSPSVAWAHEGSNNWY